MKISDKDLYILSLGFVNGYENALLQMGKPFGDTDVAEDQAEQFRDLIRLSPALSAKMQSNLNTALRVIGETPPGLPEDVLMVDVLATHRFWVTTQGNYFAYVVAETLDQAYEKFREHLDRYDVGKVEDRAFLSASRVVDPNVMMAKKKIVKGLGLKFMEKS